MRTRLALFTAILCFIVFSSCRNDTPTISNTARTDHFNWSAFIEGLEGISGISAASNNVVFVSGIKSYIISNSVKTELNFNDDKFTPTEVKSLDENYAVFLGYKSFPSDTAYFKIYDSGIIKTYTLALKQGDALNEIFILEHDKFYIANEGPLTWYEFNNGVFTQHNLPNNHTPLKFAKHNNNVYLTSQFENNLFNVFFKIENGNAVEVRSEAPDGRLFYLNNDIIKVIEENFLIEFYYYTNTGWTKFYTTYTNSNGEKAVYISGDSKDFFSVITVDNQYNFHGSVWTGREYKSQGNFPSGLTAFSTLGKASNYKSNGFYFYHSEAKKLFRAQRN
jgi:hypothetical protein